MAERRMFHTAVVESDAFLDMPIGAQALYFHLGMQADDDGFINGPRQIMRKIGRPAKELQFLEDNDFIINFDGIIVIKHWRISNTLQNDRVKPLRYPEIAKNLFLDETRAYCLDGTEDQNVYKLKNELLESNRNPKGKEKKGKEKKGKEKSIKESNPAELNRKEEKRISTHACGSVEMTSEEDSAIVPDFGDGGENYDDTYVLLHRFGKDLVHLTKPQIQGLRRIMGEVEMDIYVYRLAKLIQEGEDPGEHYQTIKNWYLERSGQNV